MPVLFTRGPCALVSFPKWPTSMPHAQKGIFFVHVRTWRGPQCIVRCLTDPFGVRKCATTVLLLLLPDLYFQHTTRGLLPPWVGNPYPLHAKRLIQRARVYRWELHGQACIRDASDCRVI